MMLPAPSRMREVFAAAAAIKTSGAEVAIVIML